MAVSPWENVAFGRQLLTTVVTDQDTDLDSGIVDGSAVKERVATPEIATMALYELLLGLVPTGQSCEIAYVGVCRIDNGETAEIWSLPDGLGLVQQLVAIPEWSRTARSSTRLNTSNRDTEQRRDT